jgi:hypothetical protein
MASVEAVGQCAAGTSPAPRHSCRQGDRPEEPPRPASAEAKWKPEQAVHALADQIGIAERSAASRDCLCFK